MDNGLRSISDITQIRRLYATGEFLQRELAANFGVKQITISNIITRKNWSHLP